MWWSSVLPLRCSAQKKEGSAEESCGSRIENREPKLQADENPQEVAPPMTTKTDQNRNVAALFLEHSRKILLEETWPRLRSTVESLSEEQVWWRPNEASNSIGNLLLHLNGNVRQWIVTSFNRQEDRRDRPAEFEEKAGGSALDLLAKLGATVEEAAAVLSRLTEADLLAPMDIQGYHTNGLAAIYHVVEHFGMHYGQILYVTKALQGKDLGFYRELNETGRAS